MLNGTKKLCTKVVFDDYFFVNLDPSVRVEEGDWRLFAHTGDCFVDWLVTAGMFAC